MADSELGELRRPPRLPEQRIHRLASWRAQGLAGGTSDDVYPADSDDDVLASDGGGEGDEGSLPLWFADAFDVVAASTSFFLSRLPLEYSEVIRLNGVTLAPSTDYTIEGSIVTLVSPSTLLRGIEDETWKLVASYAYTDVIDPPTDLVVYGQNAGNIEGGSSFITEPRYDSDVAIFVTNGAVDSITGGYETWELLHRTGIDVDPPLDPWAQISIWRGTGVATSSIVSPHRLDGPSWVYGHALFVFRDADEAPVNIRDTSTEGLIDLLATGEARTVTVPTVEGDWILLVFKTQNNTTTTTNFESADLFDVSGLTDVVRISSQVTSTYGNGLWVVFGKADSSGSASATGEIANGSGSARGSKAGFAFGFGL